MKDKIVNATVINFFYIAISFVTSFVLTPIILHRVGQEQYGIWVFLSIFSATGYFSLLDMGMQGSAIKYIAEYHATGDEDALRHTINSVVFFFICMGIVAGAVLLFLNHFFLDVLFNVPRQYAEPVKMLINLIALSFLFQFPCMGFSAVVEGLQRYDILRGVTIGCSLLNMVLVIYFLKADNGITYLTLYSLLSSLVICLLFFAASTFLLPGYRLNPLHVRLEYTKKLFDMGWKLILSKIVGLIFNNTQKIIIGALLNMLVMTQFDIINKVYMIVITVMSVMNGALVPFASRFHAENDDERLRLLFVKGTKYAVIFTMPALLFFLSMSREFIAVWVGSSYAYLGLFSSVLLIHCFLTVLTGVGSTMMVGMNRVEELLKVSVSAAVLNLVISVVAAKPFGLWGIVAATVVSYILAQIVNIWLFRDIFKIRINSFLKEVVAVPYLVGGGVLGTVFLLKRHFVFDTKMALFSFAVALYVVFGVVYLLADGSERKDLFLILRRQRA